METPNLNEIAKAYKAIKAQIDALETSLKPFKGQLEEAALDAPEMKLELDGYTVSLSECSRENFQIKDARAVLGSEVVDKFVKTSSYSQLRVLEKK
jgi:hypothetical protein